MKFSKIYKPGQDRTRNLIITGVIIFVLALVASAAVIRKAYVENLKPLNTSDQTSYVITITPGSTAGVIAEQLKAKGLIRSDWAFEWYVRNHQLRDELKAGTYIVKKSQSVGEIVNTIVAGREATDLVTILPAQRLDQIRTALIKAGFSENEVDKALDPAQYANHPALTDKPKNASLEGYLYPESFQKTAETSPKQIIRQSLDEMQLHLTPELRQSFSRSGLTLHQAIILASIVEKEVGNESDRPRVAQVFLKRYQEGIMLGADPTAFYGAIINHRKPSVDFDSLYNTRLHVGLPPGPIGNVSQSSLEAIANPAQTDWLYFVAGDDGKTYFSRTLEEHQRLTQQYCKKLCTE